ncbi:MAG: Type 1 glutamine amidotransferase-like domain-containing protein [Nanoarchaeota archaeon]
MGKIIAIGGGELKDLDTFSIDEEVVRLTGKKSPRALFIPTASGDAEGYWETFKQVYGKRLGCKTDVLRLVKETPSEAEIGRKILDSDLIYVGGGNTQTMLEAWKKFGVDNLLKQAYRKGIVLSGLSAGAICWFRYGCSDAPRFSNSSDNSLIRINGLGLVNLTLSPHHIREAHRDEGLAKIMKTTPGIGIGLDDNCAIEIVDGTYRFISSKPGAGVKKIYYKNDKPVCKRIEINSNFLLMENLLDKK